MMNARGVREKKWDGRAMNVQRISYEAFRAFVSGRFDELLGLARDRPHVENGKLHLTRSYLTELLGESTQLEELLDAYGAANNSRWGRVRMRVATIRNFSQAGYELLHLVHAVGSYSLPTVAGDFSQSTAQALTFLADLLDCTLAQLLADAHELGVEPGETSRRGRFDADENLPVGMLPRDRQTRHERSVPERVVHLASQFLATSVEAGFLHRVLDTAPDKAPELIPDVVSEEALRGTEYRFHSLQSLYDTYISDSATEAVDNDLRSLRGHVSVILHLMRVGTIFTHFHERHLSIHRHTLFCPVDCMLSNSSFYEVLFGYCLRYASYYVTAGNGLCRQMLRRYASVIEVTVPVPRYHGFHVRPSTLIAKIVQHYGSEVTMTLGGTTYDAGAPLELFRANEQINAEKRRRVAAAITGLPLDGGVPSQPAEAAAILRRAFLDLAARQIIAIHEFPLPLDDLQNSSPATLREALLDAIAKLLAMGKIDIQADLTVTFRGDRRVLHDIRILAENGYGEDDMGGNIPLPDEIAYLRH